MIRRFTLIAAAWAACITVLPAVDSEDALRGNGLQRLDHPETVPGMDGFPAAAVWKSEYDHNLDGALTIEETTEVELNSGEGGLSGNYVEHRAVGKPNNSMFAGQFIPGTPPIVNLRQDDEPGYTAI